MKNHQEELPVIDFEAPQEDKEEFNRDAFALAIVFFLLMMLIMNS